MQRVRVETRIAAPPERCFLLSLSIDLHLQSTGPTKERVIAGVSHGLIGPGENVTFRAKHFGLWLEHATVISAYHRPHYFQDRMVRGMFQNFEHDHYFEERPYGTRMLDDLRFTAPLGILGLAAESLLLKAYFKRFLETRNQVIKKTAEAVDGSWRRYLELDGAPGSG